MAVSRSDEMHRGSASAFARPAHADVLLPRIDPAAAPHASSPRNRFRLALMHAALGIRHWRMMWKLWLAPSGSSLAATVCWRPEIWGMLQAPFVSAGWSAEERFKRIVDHCALVDRLGAPFDILPNEFVDLLDLPELGWQARLKLDCPRWMLRDGLLVASLWIGSDRIQSLAFALSQEGPRRIVYVGGIQGRRSPTALELNRLLTKSAHGMRPPDLLAEIFRLLCREIGVQEIRGVSNGNRHQNSAYFRERAGFLDPVRFDYDGFWRERGGVPGPGGFYILPTQPRQRDEADVPPRKRALYRRRREMMETIASRLHAVLSDRSSLVAREHEPRWI